MKNIVKGIVILKMTMLVLTVYSMTEEIHTIKKDNLRKENPLSSMQNLNIIMSGCFEICGKFFCNNQLYNDEGLSLSLAAVKFIDGSDSAKNKQILQTSGRE